MASHIAIDRRCEKTRNTVADLIDNRNTPKEIAHRDEVSKWAIYKRRRRFELSTGTSLPRHETRGRKKKPAAVAVEPSQN